MVADTLVAQRDIEMTYPMLDHLRILNVVLTGSFVVFGLGALFVCFKLLFANAAPVSAHRSA